MSELPGWLPKLMLLEDYGGDWQRYEDAVFSQFYSDFVASRPTFRGLPVDITKNLVKGKERTFWHCIQQGPVEEERTPDLRRCERIAWIRAVIDHWDDPLIYNWSKHMGRKQRHLLWLSDEFLVVLEKRPDRWLLWTAYYTEWEHTKRRLQKEYKQTQKKPTPP